MVSLVLAGCVQGPEDNSDRTIPNGLSPADNSSGSNSTQVIPINASESPNERFKQLMELRVSKPWKASYVTSSNDSPGSVSGVIYSWNNTIGRTDLILPNSELRFYFLDGFVFSCFMSVEGSSCVNSTLEKVSENDPFIKFDMDPGSYNVSFDREIQIAGTAAECFNSTLSKKSSLVYCMSYEGIPFYSRIVEQEAYGEVSHELSIREFSVEVEEKDFYLPFESRER